ncbi:MAG: pyridoxamine 5'-phosphate oxidase family protein [Pseudomonadota bacterium]
MNFIETIAALEALYTAPNPKSLTKVVSHFTPNYRSWVEASRFVILSTVGPEGTDASPRGDDGPVVKIADEKTVLIPDWQGNNRLDSLHNIVRDPRVSLMFMVPGSDNVVRINGSAKLTADESVVAQFDKSGLRPRSVIVVTIEEMYFQCAKALMRSRLWSSSQDAKSVPTAGQFLMEQATIEDAISYDEGYASYAKEKMW